MTATAAEVKNHEATRGLARAGLLGHGILYALVGVLALFIAFGKSKGEADQHGALQELAQHSGGFVLLLLIAIGLSAYALWQLLQAAIGPAGKKDEAKERASSAVRGVLYAATAVSAWEVVVHGRTDSQSQKQQAWTAKVMQHTGGRWLIGLIGLVVVGVGAYLAYRSLQKKFAKDLEARTPQAVIRLGQVGGAARGVVVAAAGVLLVVAAIDYDPQKARGIDGALRSLRDTALGPWLLVVVALGLVLFGVYGMAEARYRKL